MKLKKSISDYRILVIDDNPSIHEDFQKILMTSTKSSNGLQEMASSIFGSEVRTPMFAQFEIDCASQGREGLEMVKRALSEDRPYAMAFVDGQQFSAK